MNFCGSAISYKKDNDDFSILDCSSQGEIYEEEIADTSSPECSEKKNPLSTLGLSSSSKNKFSVKRKLLLQKPILDIHPTNSNVFVSSEGHFQRFKRKKLSTNETNVSDQNREQKSVKKLSSLNENFVQSGVSIGSELDQCNYNPTHAALTAGLIKSPSPEIISEEDSKLKLELYHMKDEIICSQDSPGNSSVEDEEQLSFKAFCKTSDPSDTIGNLDESDAKEEIICSQDSLLDITIKTKKGINETVKLNKYLDPMKIIQDEGHEGNLNDSDIKEEIISSQDSLVDIPIKNKNCIIKSVEFNKLLDPTKVLQEKDEDGMSNICTHKEEIISSQESPNKYQHSKKNHIYNESSRPTVLLCNDDNEDHSDFDCSQEDIIYSQDSTVDISGIDSNLFSKTCDQPNVSSSPSKFSIEEAKSGKQEENIEFDGPEIDDSSERDPHFTSTSYNSALIIETTVEKMEATRNSEENNHQYNDPICSPTISNNMISSTVLHEPDSEFLVKAPKKGTLLQRSYHIISELKKEANLLSYEIQVGLRAPKGAFVSEPLIIQNIYFEGNNYIISCKPQNIEEISNQCHVKENIYLIVSHLSMDIRINSVIVIHFPLVALLGLPVMRVILFAENRVQVISSDRVTGSINISLPDSIIGPSDRKLMCVIKKKNSKTVIGAIVDQLFGGLCSLELKLLHIFKQRAIDHTIVELLTVDSENQFCLVKYSGYNLLKNSNLEVHNSYVFLGFSLMCSKVKHELRSAAEYYSSLKFKNDFICIAEPCIDSWKIKYLSKTTKNSISCTLLNSAIRNSTNHERFKLLLIEYTVFENKIFIRDESFSETIELQFDEQCCEHKMKLISLSVPLFLCGIYFLNGCLYYDKYSKIMGM